MHVSLTWAENLHLFIWENIGHACIFVVRDGISRKTEQEIKLEVDVGTHELLFRQASGLSLCWAFLRSDYSYSEEEDFVLDTVDSQNNYKSSSPDNFWCNGGHYTN